MAYICFCKDRPDSGALRRRHTPEHLRYIESIMDRVLVAGPLSRTADGAWDASCFVYDCGSAEEALKLLHDDPYFRAGIYAEVDCRRFLPAAGA